MTDADNPDDELTPDASNTADIERIEIGVEGLDELIEEGVPAQSLMTTIGGPGTGKTTLGQQFLHHALQADKRCVYFTLEEPRDRLIRSAVNRGWAFDEYVAEGQLAVVDMDPVQMATRLASIGAELPDIIADFGADRVVVDSVSLLELMFETPARRRNELYDFTNGLRRAGVTTMLTSESADDSASTSKFKMVEYLTDAVFVMRRVREDGGQDPGLAIEIMKIRDADHVRGAKPLELTGQGIEVYPQANIF